MVFETNEKRMYILLVKKQKQIFTIKERERDIRHMERDIQIDKGKPMAPLQGLFFNTKVSFIFSYHRELTHTTTFLIPVLVY